MVEVNIQHDWVKDKTAEFYKKNKDQIIQLKEKIEDSSKTKEELNILLKDIFSDKKNIIDTLQIGLNQLKGKKGEKYKTTYENLSSGFIIALQSALVTIDFNKYNITIDGIYGANTQKAIEAFQNANQLGVDGQAGEITITKMIEALEGTTTNTSSTNTEKKDTYGNTINTITDLKDLPQNYRWTGNEVYIFRKDGKMYKFYGNGRGGVYNGKEQRFDMKNTKDLVDELVNKQTTTETIDVKKITNLVKEATSLGGIDILPENHVKDLNEVEKKELEKEYKEYIDLGKITSIQKEFIDKSIGFRSPHENKDYFGSYLEGYSTSILGKPNPNIDSYILYKAMKGAGTDTESINRLLSKRIENINNKQLPEHYLGKIFHAFNSYSNKDLLNSLKTDDYDIFNTYKNDINIGLSKVRSDNYPEIYHTQI